VFTKTLRTIVAGLLLLPLTATAEPIRVSFLSESGALRDTLAVLTNAGCTKEAMVRFKVAVESYHAMPFAFDFTKFPQSRGGFYQFESASRLVAALPHQLCDTEHDYDFNCFDTLITILGDGLRTRLRPDEIFGPTLVPHTATNGAFMILPTATARDAFTVAYTEWYRDATKDAFPQSMSDSRISLTAALFRSHVLPMSTSERKLEDGVLEVLRANWKRQDMTFPKGVEVVLCHQVHFPQFWFVTAHVGLLVSRNKGYTYVEKSGGRGPFVRLDFEERRDLLAWLSGMFRGASKFGYTHHFATFNDAKIQKLEFTK
jgi:hypothetical protein